VTSDPTLTALQSAVRLLQSGRIVEAEAALTALVQTHPANADAIALLGLASAQRGDNARAARLMAQALTLMPRHAATLFNYGKVLTKLERWEEAADVFSRVLSLRNDHVEARKGRALALHKLGRDAEALADLDATLNPFTDDVASLMLRARLRFDADRAAEAVGDYDRVIAIDPANGDAFNNRGIALDRLERYDDALKSYDAALAQKPDDHNVLHNRGAALIGLKRFEEALPLFERLIIEEPYLADNWSCHGVALASLGRIEDSIASFDHGLLLDPNSVRARNGKGMALTALGRVREGINEYRAALSAHPDNAMTHGNIAFALLVSGDLENGFAEYEWRRKDGPIGKSQRMYPQSEWQGEALAGKTLLLHPEQGLGDIVQFARFIPRLIAAGARVVLEVPAGLEALCRTVAPELVVVRSGDILPPFDVHAPLMSLGHKLNIALEDVPADIPYLHADADKRIAWRDRLSKLKAPRVGVCWSGSRIHRNDQARSLALADFARVLHAPNISFVSLQRDVRESDASLLASLDHVTQVMEHVADFADTAALIAELDLVVSVDTSVAHVAGALGTPVWILISAAPDWRWLLERKDSPWYLTARLFRQRSLTDGWRRVLEEVCKSLPALSKK